MTKILDIVGDLDIIIIGILGAGLFVLAPDLQGQIVAGLIGFLGAKATIK